ncbi:imm11 family protein [Pyxidicoccus xibeiensis]|uniref:imm11 family protein n=1 Tax=Pyxidicoccus xibeiensis TaxID=2906759 RepID=UPI0020A77988|nr:DUF1629 domain-containing protein [Pyxidicoccus xibeiensis]
MPDIYKPAEGVPTGTLFSSGLKFNMAAEVKGFRIPDVIDNAVGYFMVSERMKSLLEKARADVEYIRFILLNHKGRVASDQCYIVNVLGTRDWADMSRCEGRTSAVDKHRSFARLKRLVLKDEEVDPSVDLFRVQAMPQLMILRSDFKDYLQKEGITGARFHEVGAPVDLR